MDRQTTFLLALGLLIAAALAVGVSGWVLWARERTLAKIGRVGLSTATDGAHHREGVEGA
jgi:hypothetical protein